MAELRRRDTLTKQLVQVLSERIEKGDYKSGDKLPSEQELIDQFGVSRTVVREAIANLKAVGMVSTQQGVGAFVLRQSAVMPYRIEEASLDLVNEAISVLEVRISLESEAAFLAAIRRSPKNLETMRAALQSMRDAIKNGEDAVQGDLAFHSSVAEATGNKHFLSLFTYLGNILIPRTRLHTFQLDGNTREAYLQRIVHEHEGIHAAIERQDPEGARAAMRLHLNGSRDRLAARSGSST